MAGHVEWCALSERRESKGSWQAPPTSFDSPLRGSLVAGRVTDLNRLAS